MSSLMDISLILSAVEMAFGKVDFAQLQKIYDIPADTEVTGRKKDIALQDVQELKSKLYPDENYISTSYVERANLTMRMHMRRVPPTMAVGLINRLMTLERYC